MGLNLEHNFIIEEDLERQSKNIWYLIETSFIKQLIKTFSIMIHRANYQQLRIGLASPEQIRGWAERELPNGDIVGQVN